jgi:hypothetical protein
MRRKIMLFISSLALFFSVFGLNAVQVHAQTTSASACQTRAKDGMSFLFQFPTWYKYLELNSNCEVADFKVPGDIWLVAIAVVEILLRVAGLVAFGFTVWGGFKYVMSRGNPSEASKARQTIIDAIIGIAITTIATVLVAYIGKALMA